jgi:hypothetical protein
MKGFGDMGFGNGAGEGGADSGAPTVENFDPTQGAAIDAYTSISFDVVAPNGLASLVVLVRYTEIGTSEVAYDRGGFAPAYVQRSTRANIGGTAHFTLSRKGGWNASPTISVQGADLVGHEIPEVT